MVGSISRKYSVTAIETIPASNRPPHTYRSLPRDPKPDIPELIRRPAKNPHPQMTASKYSLGSDHKKIASS